MISAELAKIQSIILHKVGSRLGDEGIKFSHDLLHIDSNISELLLQYFFTPFKSTEYHRFWHETDINLNEIYVYLSKIFEDESSLLEQSKNIAKHLYEKSTHPKIKAGELYIVYLKGCSIEGIDTDAIGIFKSESKETYLRIFPSGDSFEIDSDKGININKLDKGCIVFNAEKDKGYIISIVDTTKGNDVAQFWADDFLQTKIRQDEYSQTESVMSLCRNFVKENPAIDKIGEIEIMNKTLNYLKQNDTFDVKSFSSEVFSNRELDSSFDNYRQAYEREREVVIPSEFKLSEQALKKNTRSLKSLIKLDSNFKISIEGDTRYLEKGYDENRKLNFYKLYYKKEE